MPAPEEILVGLGEIANGWRALAVLWHGYFAAIALAIVLGVRPRKRVVGILLGVPLLSVSFLAWKNGNPFNGGLFAVSALALLAVALFLPRVPVRVASPWFSFSGTLMFLFGWVYPHFLESKSSLSYLYSAPTGLIPCPTLSIIIGLSLILGALGSRTWSRILGALGGFYAITGAAYLGVIIDWGLLFGASMIVLAGTGYPSEQRTS
jgi:hypothetical protein